MASKRRVRERSCTQKKRYATATEAQRAFLHTLTPGEYVRPYRCGFCSQFHLGHGKEPGILRGRRP